MEDDRQTLRVWTKWNKGSPIQIRTSNTHRRRSRNDSEGEEFQPVLVENTRLQNLHLLKHDDNGSKHGAHQRWSSGRNVHGHLPCQILLFFLHGCSQTLRGWQIKHVSKIPSRPLDRGGRSLQAIWDRFLLPQHMRRSIDWHNALARNIANRQPSTDMGETRFDPGRYRSSTCGGNVSGRFCGTKIALAKSSKV